jgi:hypothetical protein
MTQAKHDSKQDSQAKRDPLLAALIARLPAAPEWPCADRSAWLRMMAMAFDVVYGPCGGVPIAPDGDAPAPTQARAADEAAAALRAQPAQAAPSGAPRFYVDHDGFAMGVFDNGAGCRPIAIEDLLLGATLWDERTGMESGDIAAILWRDIGTTRRSLPAGVTLKPAFEAP